MTHLYMLTRGQKDLVDNYINDLQAQHFSYKPNPHTAPGYLQLGVRPVQLWEITFPREHLNEVLATIQPSTLKARDEKGLRKVFAWAISLKKYLGLKPIPVLKTQDTPEGKMFIDDEGKPINRRLIRNPGGFVCRYGVGMKEDKDVKVEMI